MTFEILDSAKSYINELDLIKHEGTIRFDTNIKTLELGGLIFRLDYPNFYFACDVNDNHIILERNTDKCILDLNQIDASIFGEYVVVFIIWSPTKLTLIVREKEAKKNALTINKEIETEIFYPSRQSTQQITNNLPDGNIIFTSDEEFRNYCHMLLISMQLKLKENPTVDFCWNKAKEEKKVIQQTPKDEIDIHGIIHTFLNNIRQPNVKVHYEYNTNNGNVDFVFSTMIDNIYSTFCLEVKNAHSQDVVTGLTNQLTEYMKNTKSKYGAYLILYYKCSMFDKPKQNLHELQLKFNKLRFPLSDNIRIFFLDLSKKTPASKL